MALRQRGFARRAQLPQSLPEQVDKVKEGKRRHVSEGAVLGGLLGAALITRLFRIAEPGAVVFDELHFGRFMERHLRREFSFDIHPWLGKLTLALFAWLSGYRADGFSFDVSVPYENKDYVFARLPSALFGSACVPLTYLICRELDLSVLSSVLGAALPLFDNLLITESRLILLDAQLIFYLTLTLLCALRLWRRAPESTMRVPGGRIQKGYLVYLVATAASGAAAVSVKWTAAATPFLVAVVCGLGVCFIRRPTPLLHCAIAGCVGIGVYVVPWYLHLLVSSKSTPEAVRMGDRFRTTLRGNSSFPYDPAHDVGFPESLYELHWRQFRANQKVKTRHLWESRWYEWPLNLRGIYYYVDKAPAYTEAHPVVRVVYLLQNPAGAVWVFVSVVTYATMLPLVCRYRHEIGMGHHLKGVMTKGGFLLAGYLLNLIPYMFVERCYFLYHYLPSLMYGQLLTAVLVDALPRRIRLALTALILLTIAAAFVFWAPWIYCMPIDMEGIVRRQWMPRWN